MSEFAVRNMELGDVLQAVALQKLAFPPPFSEDLHWDPEHLTSHIKLFPEGQWVAVSNGRIIGSCSNSMIDEAHWQAHASWGKTVGGPYLHAFDREGTTLYGLDITVHPEYRKQGVGRAFYGARFDFVRRHNLMRYGTGCRLPDFRAYAAAHPGVEVEDYAQRVVRGEATDRTLTPLLRYDLCFLGVVRNYMPDEESADSAALLEWTL